MKYKDLQKNKACPPTRRGFVILFAVTLAAILLAIALGVSNIALKEIKFGTSAKDTNNAFFAADAGVECARINDKSSSNSFVQTGGISTISCMGSNITINGSYPVWDFVISGLGSSNQGCAKVTVNKTSIPNTTIISKGYNNGSGAGTCNPTSNSVERELTTTYGGGVITAVTPAPVFRSPATTARGSILGFFPTITIDKPASVAQNDVLIASIAVRPYTAIITPPAGWNLVVRTDNPGAPGQSNSIATYSKVAGLVEPVNYTWTMNTATSIVGGILAFSGVNIASSVVGSGQNSAVAFDCPAPIVNTTVANTMIITVHAFSSQTTWTPPTGMTEAVDNTSTGAINNAGESMEINYMAQVSVGTTGVLTATANGTILNGDQDAGNAQVILLQP